MSLRHLKQIALSKFFFPFVPSQLTYTVPATSPPPSRALTTPASSINLGSLKSELKTELENYIRLQIDSILPRQGGTNSPIVVYTSAPALATADFESFRTNSVVPEIHYHVTNQSNSDAERNSINLSNITDGGTFTNASISNSTFSGSLVSASSLSFGNATGTSATTTNFFSTTASSTNLFATTGNIGTLTVGSCTGCGNSGADFPFTVTGYGVSTSTTLGFLQGFLSTASSTIDSNLRITGNLLVNGNSTTTNATTTNLFSTTASSTNLYSTNLFGNTANLTESGNLFYTDTRVNSYIHASTTIPKTYTANTFTGAQILDNITRSTSTNATTTNLFSTTASSTNLFTQLFTLNGFTLSSTANGTIGGTNTGDVTLAGTPDYLTISGQTITRNKLDISDDTNATGGLGLTLTANDFACDTANSTTFGCLASADWTTFNNKLSSYDAFTHPAYGGSATTSLLTLSGGFLNTAASSTIVGNLLITGNSTTTNATTTNFFSTTASSTNLYSTNLFGNTANLTESGNLFYTDVRVNSYIHASTTIPKTYTANTFTGAQILDNITRSTSTNATTTNLFSTTASSTNLFTQLFTLNGFTLSSTANGTIGGTNTGDVTLAGTPDYLTISGQIITRNKLDISDDTNATGGLGLTLTANDFACDTASASVFGCLASADWTTFNNKLGSYDAWTHPAYGGSATTSLLTLSGGFLNTAASSTIVGNLLITGNSTTTNATTTNFFSTTASSTNLYSTNLFGNTANLTESGNLFYTDTRVNSYIHASTTIPKTYTANTFTGAQILDSITRSTTTNATTTNLFSTTASSTNLFTQLFTLNGYTLSSTANGTIGGTNTGDVTLAGTPDYLTISGQTITRNKLDISDDTNATGGLGLTLTANDFACDTANSTTFGCLASADWTTFNNKLGAYDAWTHPAYGGSATTSLLTLSGGFLNTAASSTIVGNLLITGNSTTTNATTTNFFTTTASTTNFFGAGLTTCQSNNVLTYDGAGKFGCEADDSGSGSGSDPFTHPSFGFSATTSQMLFGTSTASNYQLTVSSSTAPQLSLSSGAGFGQWTFRNAGGNLYFATTTVAGTATTSTSALTIIGSSGNVGIASSTPWGLFSINPDRLGSGVPAFVVGSSTATLFSITSGGSPGGVFNYGTNATSTIPNNKLYAWTIATSTTATPIFRIDTTSSGAGSVSATTSIRGGFVLDDGAFNYDSFAGVTSVDSLSTGPMAFDDNAGILSWMDMPVSTTTAGIVMSYSAQIGGTSILTVYSESKGTGGGIKNGRIGIGTTSPYALLSLATTTNQLIDLFAISTSTSGIVFKVDSYGRTYGDGAYASPAADYAEYFYTKSAALKSGEVVCVDILENNAVKRCERGADNNVMGIVSTKPAVIGNYIKAAEADPSHYAIIGMLGQVDAFVSAENGPINVGDSLTSASSTPGYAMRALGGDSTVAVALEPFNGTGTSTSLSTSKIKVLISRRNKSLEVEEVESLVIERVANMKIEDKVGQMIKQSVDNLNLDPKITAIARDEVEQAIAKLNESFDSLKIQTLASTTLSLGVRLDDIESVFAPATSTATSTTNSFADNFFKNLFNRLTAWLASAANGIGDFFANRVRTKELCVSDDSGAETCLSKAQLDQLLGNVVSSDAEESVVPAPSELIELIESENSSESERPEDSSEPERPVIEEPVVPDDSVGLPAGEAGTPTDNVEAEPAPEPTPESVSTP